MRDASRWQSLTFCDTERAELQHKARPCAIKLRLHEARGLNCDRDEAVLCSSHGTAYSTFSRSLQDGKYVEVSFHDHVRMSQRSVGSPSNPASRLTCRAGELSKHCAWLQVWGDSVMSIELTDVSRLCLLCCERPAEGIQLNQAVTNRADST